MDDKLTGTKGVSNLKLSVFWTLSESFLSKAFPCIPFSITHGTVELSSENFVISVFGNPDFCVNQNFYDSFEFLKSHIQHAVSIFIIQERQICHLV